MQVISCSQACFVRVAITPHEYVVLVVYSHSFLADCNHMFSTSSYLLYRYAIIDKPGNLFELRDIRFIINYSTQ